MFPNSSYQGSSSPTTFLIIAVIIVLLAARQLREKEVKPQSLWLMPALLCILYIPLFLSDISKNMLAVGFIAIGLVIGGALGWLRGSMTRLRVDAATGAILQQGSAVGVALYVGTFVLRLIIEAVWGGSGSLLAILVAAGLLGVSLGTIAGTRVYLALAYQRLRR